MPHETHHVLRRRALLFHHRGLFRVRGHLVRRRRVQLPARVVPPPRHPPDGAAALVGPRPPRSADDDGGGIGVAPALEKDMVICLLVACSFDCFGVSSTERKLSSTNSSNRQQSVEMQLE